MMSLLLLLWFLGELQASFGSEHSEDDCVRVGEHSEDLIVGETAWAQNISTQEL